MSQSIKGTQVASCHIRHGDKNVPVKLDSMQGIGMCNGAYQIFEKFEYRKVASSRPV
jgi:hypothetical protein